MDTLHSIILGAIQGITEFVPISSSAHLVLFPYLFNWDYNGLQFDVALHFGTFLAVIAFFWQDWVVIIRNAILPSSNNQTLNPKQIQNSNDPKSKSQNALCPMPNAQPDRYPKNILWQILVASIPAFVAGYFLEPAVEKYLHSPLLLISNLVIFGLLLWATEYISSNMLKNSKIGYSESFIIGCAQAIALIPGVSRSGITMTAAKLVGFSKENAARFSFILGTPAVLGTFVYHIPALNFSEISISFWMGVISSTIFGFLAIKYLIQYLKKGSFAVFAVYRVILAAVVLIFYLYK